MSWRSTTGRSGRKGNEMTWRSEWKERRHGVSVPFPLVPLIHLLTSSLVHSARRLFSLPFRLSRSPSPLIVGRRERRDAVADVGRGDEMRARMRRNDVKGNGEKIDRGRSLARSVLVSLSVLRTVLLLPTGLSFLSLPTVLHPLSSRPAGPRLARRTVWEGEEETQAPSIP